MREQIEKVRRHMKTQFIEPVFHRCDFIIGQVVIEMFGYVTTDCCVLTPSTAERPAASAFLLRLRK